METLPQLYIDFKLLPDYNAAYTPCWSSSSSSYSSSGSYSTDSSTDAAPCTGTNPLEIQTYINKLYFAFGIVHFINAFMYYWSWLPSGFRFYDRVMIPEVRRQAFANAAELARAISARAVP